MTVGFFIAAEKVRRARAAITAEKHAIAAALPDFEAYQKQAVIEQQAKVIPEPMPLAEVLGIVGHPCPHCSRKFIQLGALRTHIRLKHADQAQ
jgi:hypothetical protein